MNEDIINRLENRLFWSDAEEAVNEIKNLRKTAADWKETAQLLAVDLGKIEYAQALYEDISDGLYDKVRERMIKTKENDA
jgi:hypothetical protein